MGRTKRKNAGFTLVEVLIVVVIIAIATAMVGLSYSLVTNANVSKAANTLDTAFNKARVESMSRGVANGKLTVYTENGCLLYKIGDDPEGTLICNSMITVSTVMGSYTDVTGTPCPDNAIIAEYEFNSSGIVNQYAGTTPTKFIFNRANRTVETVLYLETGKHATNLL